MSNPLDAKTAHGRLRLALIALRKAEGNAVTLFADILRRRLFRELGFATIHIYASEALGFSRTKCYEFIRLAESLDQLPQLKAGIESGQVPWTKARQIVKVATPNTEKRWIEMADKKSRRELEREVAASRAMRDRPKRERAQGELMMESSDGKLEPPAAAPVQSLTLRLEPMQRARFDALVEKLMKRHHQSREQVLLMALEAMLGSDEGSSRRDSSLGEASAGGEWGSSIDKSSTRVDAVTHYQVVIYQCDTCKSQAVGPERSALSAAESAQVACDSQVLVPGKRNRRSIPPSRRGAVLLRDGHRCRTRGCGATNFLEVHHLRARNQGGGNSEENLITLCASCHRHLHERGSSARWLRDAEER